MVVKSMDDIRKEMTQERRHEIFAALEGRAIVYDEDCPKQTPEQLSRFKPAVPRRSPA